MTSLHSGQHHHHHLGPSASWHYDDGQSHENGSWPSSSVDFTSIPPAHTHPDLPSEPPGYDGELIALIARHALSRAVQTLIPGRGGRVRILVSDRPLPIPLQRSAPGFPGQPAVAASRVRLHLARRGRDLQTTSEERRTCVYPFCPSAWPLAAPASPATSGCSCRLRRARSPCNIWKPG